MNAQANDYAFCCVSCGWPVDDDSFCTNAECNLSCEGALPPDFTLTRISETTKSPAFGDVHFTAAVMRHWPDWLDLAVINTAEEFRGQHLPALGVYRYTLHAPGGIVLDVADIDTRSGVIL